MFTVDLIMQPKIRRVRATLPETHHPLWQGIGRRIFWAAPDFRHTCRCKACSHQCTPRCTHTSCRPFQKSTSCRTSWVVPPPGTCSCTPRPV
jgi:hypothetical protein